MAIVLGALRIRDLNKGIVKDQDEKRGDVGGGS